MHAPMNNHLCYSKGVTISTKKARKLLAFLLPKSTVTKPVSRQTAASPEGRCSLLGFTQGINRTQDELQHAPVI